MFGKIPGRIALIKKSIHRKKTLRRLEKLTIDADQLKFTFSWVCSGINETAYQNNFNYKYTIFGHSLELKDIDWHRDYVSGFVYPVERFDKIKISRWFDKGIDVKFPWEISRFYFAVLLAQHYKVTGDKKYYDIYREHIIDWVEKNPFLYGVNWHCTMEVAIRAVNWIVAANIFGEICKQDSGFREKVLHSLIQHGHYISAFPEIKYPGRSNNHLIADYAGLLFIAISLPEYPASTEWKKQAVDGLVTCMETQINDDGTDFEGSIPYHRFVLELFGYAALLCTANKITLPGNYYEKLFKMFEFVASYTDHHGNAPQIGDNDSGRMMILHDADEHDHSYLLDLGEHIFDYTFRSQCKKRNPGYRNWLPEEQGIGLLIEKERATIDANFS